MDAQNAPGSDKTKPPASPTRAGGVQPDDEQIRKKNTGANHDPAVKNNSASPSVSTNRVTDPVTNLVTNPVTDTVSKNIKESGGGPAELPRSSHLDTKSPPDLTIASAADNNVDSSNADRDSDAETIVLPGKDGHSPSKVRKVKHEEASDGGITHASLKLPELASTRDGNNRQEKTPSRGAEKPRLGHSLHENKHFEKFAKAQDASSGLSSAPASPPDHRRTRRRTVHDSDSDSDPKQHRIRKPSADKARAKSTDQVLSSQKRKAYRTESGDEAEEQKSARRRRLDDRGEWVAKDERSALKDGIKSYGREHKSTTTSTSSRPHAESNKQRSISPPSRAHRRSASTHLSSQQPSSNGVAQKKRRLPPPLRSTEYHSDESSTAGGSPHPRTAKSRKLSTPAAADANPSPARPPASKKHVDAHGQTPLARACNKGEFEVAKQRLAERPEDLNVADYAGNTPLQSAAIHGYEDIVKLLIDAGCNLDCVNEVKDTPLLDAVDNGHLGVVKLLLDAGVNPRKANLEGEEPLDRVNDEFENADEIRAALIEAKQRHAEVRRTSEDHQTPAELNDTRSSHGPESPRHSPGPAGLGRRPTASRATKTGNHHLYLNLDAKTLRAAAARGDEETVTRVLQVRDNCDDPAAMVAAARGGHEVVLQLLLALGGANPDPPPVRGMAQEVGTPMLAAIGQENINVIQLLLSQQNFDPTRRFRGEYYFEIARRRQGTNWKEEEQLLKNAFDAYRKAQRENKTKSPNRREREKAQQDRDRDRDRDAKRAGRTMGKEEPRSEHRNNNNSTQQPATPSRESEMKKSKAVRKSDSSTHHDEQPSPKRGAIGKAKREERSAASDGESSPAASRKSLAKTRKADSDMAGLSSEGETVKPRRKLVSKGELREKGEEREKQRRASIMSSSAAPLKDHPSSPHDSRQQHEDHADRPKGERISEKYHDRTKAIKREESRDSSSKVSASAEHSTKRQRSSLSPPHHPGASDKDGTETPVKRRRLDAEGKERRPPKASDSSVDNQPKPARDVVPKLKSGSREGDDGGGRKQQPSNQSGSGPSDCQANEAAKSSSGDKPSIQVKSEDVEVEVPAVTVAVSSKRAEESSEERAQPERQEEKKKRREAAEAEEARRNEEKKRREEQESKRREEEQQRRRRREAEEEESKRKAAEEAEQEERKRRERERKRLAEEEQQKREAEERERKRREEERKRAEEEKRRIEEKKRAEEEKRRAEEKRRLEEEKKRAEEEEKERKRKEEEDQRRRQREEEERLRQEQLQREEEERKEREHREHLKRREEAERKRAAHEEAMRRAREEQERREREAKLPPLLRWLVNCPNPQLPALADKFKVVHGVRHDTIRTETIGTPEGREQWVLNIQVALLLGLKDLELTRYTAWERIPATDLAKEVTWSLEQDHYALTNKPLYDLGRSLRDYYGAGQDPDRMNFHTMHQLRKEARGKFMGMDMFFVKLSDLMYVVPTFAHLRNVKVHVLYKELPESEAHWSRLQLPQRWKQDPDAARYRGFAPQYTYYRNGVKLGENLPQTYAVSKEPFSEKRVPRRGLVRVFPDEPDYAKLCKEQGLEHLLREPTTKKTPAPAPLNGTNPSPIGQTDETEKATNPSAGQDQPSTAAPSAPTAAASVVGSSGNPQPLVNGVHGAPGAGDTDTR